MSIPTQPMLRVVNWCVLLPDVFVELLNEERFKNVILFAVTAMLSLWHPSEVRFNCPGTIWRRGHPHSCGRF